MSFPQEKKHLLGVRTTHWAGTLAFLLLVFTGAEMTMVHPRFYWGEVGNDLTPALFELPVSRNYRHGGWENTTPFFVTVKSPVSSSRTYDIFNQNGWGRSLHFLAAWILVIAGLFYFISVIGSGHIRNSLMPAMNELSFRSLRRDIADHLRKKLAFVKGPNYGPLQKISYCIVLFFLFPVVILSGLTMSPAVAAAWPFLLKIFFGAQSARTIHFITAALLVLFLLVHIIMIIRTGFIKHMRAMITGK